MTILVIAVALALPAALRVAVNNAVAVSDSWQGAADFTVYLKLGVSEDAARRALVRGDVSVAYRLAANHGETTDGPSFTEGEWLAGWIALRFLEDRKIAYEHFTRLFAGVSTSISQSRAAFWMSSGVMAGSKPLSRICIPRLPRN